jgi:hypothetical protein
VEEVEEDDKDKEDDDDVNEINARRDTAGDETSKSSLSDILGAQLMQLVVRFQFLRMPERGVS